MKKILVAIILLAFPVLGYCQFGSLLNRVKENIEKKAAGSLNKKIDGVLGNERKGENSSSGPDKSDQKEELQGFKAYSNFDFVPGKDIIYVEDFIKADLGELPINWTTRSKADVQVIDGIQGKWLRGYKEGHTVSVNNNELGDNYSIEFDLIYYFRPNDHNYVWPDLQIGIMNNYIVDYKNASGNVSERSGENSFTLNIHPSDESSAWIETFGIKPKFISEKSKMPFFNKKFNQVQHYSIQVQKSRLRIWIDEKKIFDLPQAILSDKKMARLKIALGSTSFDEDQVGYFISNVKMANGEVDARYQLVEVGKYSTDGILFELNSARIKPSSYGIIKELAVALKANPSVNIKVIGHTSNDGNNKDNMELSLKRALAVKSCFEKDFGIETTRIQYEGKGDSEPIAKNASYEGREKNRRVEFIKL